MSSIQYQKDNNNIIHLVLNKANSAVNLMDLNFTADFSAAIEKLKSDQFDGVIVRSTKSTFFAGGDISMLYQTNDDNAQQLFDMTMELKAAMRHLETCGKPVVACINGSALGGGFELALACHHRISLDSNAVQLGLPEVNLGLLPGGGGLTRMVRLLGLETAMPYLTQGKLFRPSQGLSAGLIDQLVSSADQLTAQAIAWIKANPEYAQPYDVKGFKIPGGAPNHPAVAQMLPVSPVVLRAATKGTLPAPEAILSTMIEGAQVDFDTACRIESRYFVELARGKISKNLINTFWFQQNEIKAGKNRPEGAKTQFTKVAVIGAGMMGAGIAYACASKGISVVLKDISLAAAEKGKDYSRKLLQKRLDKSRITADKMKRTLSLIQCSEDVKELADCDLVIEAVFENRELKAQVTKETESVLPANAVFGSNTSTLPITGLAKASGKPENFIGIHFFSPVDKMPLVEIICGEQTSNETLTKAYDLTIQLGKTPIVVNDSRGFYTSRVFQTFVKEGVSMLLEAEPAEIENAAWLCGFPVGPLAVLDEVSLTLVDSIRKQTEKDLLTEDKQPEQHPADEIITNMLASDRVGKLTGKGFYDYQGKNKVLWPHLADKYKDSDTSIPLIDIKERLLFVMALETVRCFEEQVLRSIGDANIGAVFGIGYPQWTGGTLQYINHYGLAQFVERAQQLAEQYGERFEPTPGLKQMAINGEQY